MIKPNFSVNSRILGKEIEHGLIAGSSNFHGQDLVNIVRSALVAVFYEAGEKTSKCIKNI